MGPDIAPATADRVRPLAVMLGHAFVGEPMMTWPMGGDESDLAERLAVEFELLNAHLIGYEMLWEAGAGLGAALWVPPGRAQLIWEANEASWAQVQALTADGGRRHRLLWEWVDTMMPDEPVWFLDQIGVAAQARGQGVGAALVELGLDLARADGVGAFLETATPGNVAYYERFGFSVVADGDVPDDGPHVWFMRLDP